MDIQHKETKKIIRNVVRTVPAIAMLGWEFMKYSKDMQSATLFGEHIYIVV